MEKSENQNRAALLTGGGGAALAVVRLSGPRTAEFLQTHFSGRFAQGRCVHGRLIDQHDVLDDPVVVFDPNGRWADVSLHGGPWVVRAVLDLARREGFEIIGSTDDVAPAVAVDAQSPLETEILTHLPLARTELAVRTLLAQRDAWANVNVQTIPEILADRALWWLLHPPRVAIVGAPNVGKSTLANRLFEQQRSITADLPGTTRDWVGEIANLDGLAVMLVDTPGVRETHDHIERTAIHRAGGEIRRADLLVLVLDVTRPLSGEQTALLDRFPDALRIVNKIDRPAMWKPADVDGLATVATSGQGVADLRRAIRRRFGCDALDPHRPRWWTPRQRDILQRAAADPNVLDQL